MRRSTMLYVKIILVLGTIASFILFYEKDTAVLFSADVVSSFSEVSINTTGIEFLVDTPTCRIPRLSPFDPSIISLLKPARIFTCTKFPRLTFVYQNKLVINRTTMGSKFGYCKYQAINRPTYVKDHDYYQYGPESGEFTTTREIKEDFIRVRCYNRANGHMYTNFHQFIHKKRRVEQRSNILFQKHVAYSGNRDKMNVLMVGVDSVSRLNSQRYMRETRSFLLKDLGAIEFEGYNKVADNTFVNIVPMTLGKFLEEVPWNETMSKIPLDKYNFIWKQFSKRGYRTLYAEDQPKIAIFDFLKAGFHKKPADYFNRHFSLAMSKENSLWYNSDKCIGNRLETEIILEYVQQFVTTYHSRPYFAFAFITGLTHDLLENSAAADRPYLNFLRNLKSSDSLNNTVLVFYSDHGIRFGAVRETYIGKMEERLPFMFLVFPEWFEKKYPDILKNLRINANRLTTPFDIYKTLQDILFFNGKIGATRFKNETLRNMQNTKSISNDTSHKDISLFDVVPEQRTCENAGILPHWCTCIQHESLQTDDRLVRTLASNVLSKINDNLKHDSNICEILEIDKIVSALKFVPSDKVLRFRSSKNDVINRHVTYGDRVKTFVDYQLTIKTRPGGGVFEATIRYNEFMDSYDVKGDISRINMYGSQSYCVQNHNLKKFCYCKVKRLF